MLKYINKVYVSLLSFAILGLPVLASESDNKRPRVVAAQAADGLMAQDPHEIGQIADGIWTGQGVTADREPIYFGLELITPDNIRGWCTFFNDTLEMQDMVSRVIDSIADDPDGADLEMAKWSGFSPEEYAQFIQKLKRAGFNTNPNKKKQLEASAFPGLIETRDDQGGDFQAYISKVPVRGRLNFNNAQEGPLTIARFYQKYHNLLMCVGVHDLDDDDEMYLDMGIGRNIVSMIDGGYKNLSLPLHGFPAAVAQIYFPHKSYMYVDNPFRSMHDILCAELSPGDMFIGYGHGENYGFPAFPLSDDEDADSESDSESDSEQSHIVHKMHIIKVEPLARFYRSVQQ